MKGSTTVSFVYGPDRAVTFRPSSIPPPGGTQTETLHYVGKLFERVKTAAGADIYKNYVYAGGSLIAIDTHSTSPGSIYTLHYAHLGSIDVLTNASGMVVERRSYAPLR